jgi:ABC-2 type transport system ATP-binding protein
MECGTPASIKAMVRGQVIELRPDPMPRAQEVLAGQPDVLEVQVYGDLLHVFVLDAQQRAPALRSALESEGVTLNGLRVIQPRMEEAFISLMGKRNA